MYKRKNKLREATHCLQRSLTNDDGWALTAGALLGFGLVERGMDKKITKRRAKTQHTSEMKGDER